MEQNKTDVQKIAAEVAVELDMPKVTVNKVVRKFVECVTNHVAAGDYLSIKGLVTFYAKEYAEREVTSPATQKKVIVPAHMVTRARVAKCLRSRAAENALKP